MDKNGVVQIRDARPEDAEIIAPHLRQCDVDELSASVGGSPVDIVRRSIELSAGGGWCKIGFYGEVPILVFGVNPFPKHPTVGIPWMLATDALYIPEVTEDFKKRDQGYVDLMNKTFPFLINYVDDRNEVSKRWLKSVGFKFTRKVDYGVQKLPFWEFVRAKKNV